MVKEWECLSCGYIHEGERAPKKCPECGENDWEFYEYDDEDFEEFEEDFEEELEEEEEGEDY